MPIVAEQGSTRSVVVERPWRAEAPSDFPHFSSLVPPGMVQVGAYSMHFATTRSDFAAVQRLRFRSYNAILGSSSEHRGRRLDGDAHDPWYHHVMVRHYANGPIVGTCRLQTASMAAARTGFYSSALFDLRDVPESIRFGAIEIGRACLDPGHESDTVLALLWRGIARYMIWNSARYAFGSASLPGMSDRTAGDAWKVIHARRLLHDRVLVQPREHSRALGDNLRRSPLIDAGSISAKLPLLFERYLAVGARVCSTPAFNRALGTTDFLMLLEVALLDDERRSALFRAA